MTAKKIWRFYFVTEKLFFEISDGHTTKIRYYDISGHTGFSGIVIIKNI